MNDQTEPGTSLVEQKAKTPAKARLAADGHGVMAFHPRNIDEAQRYASGMIAGGIVPDCFRVNGRKDNEPNAPLVLMGVLKSLEIGFPPQTGIGFLLPINGRFTVWGDGAWALVQRSKQLKSHTVTWHWPDKDGKMKSGPRLLWPDQHKAPLDRWPDEISCEVKMWRAGQDDPWIGEYSVGRARRANLWGNAMKKPWIIDPTRMLFNRARAFPMRDGFADALFGLGIAEEVIDHTETRKIDRRIDNSALDDDGGIEELAIADQSATADQLANRTSAYKAGLVMIQSLEQLEEWQTTQDHIALMDELRRRDQDAYDALIAANARRYQEIEQAEITAQKERDAEVVDAEIEEVDQEAGISADYQAGVASGATEAAATNPTGEDLFRGDE